jgi:hypothetical protein
MDGFGFDVEVLYIASHLGYRTLEVPVRWNDVAGTKVSMWLGAKGFWDPVRECAGTARAASIVSLRSRAGRIIVAYEGSRMWIDRNAWEMLPRDGILVVRIRQPGRLSGNLLHKTPDSASNN